MSAKHAKKQKTHSIPRQGPIRKECSTWDQAGHTRNNCSGRANGSGASRTKIPTMETTFNIRDSASCLQSYNTNYDLKLP